MANTPPEHDPYEPAAARLLAARPVYLSLEPILRASLLHDIHQALREAAGLEPHYAEDKRARELGRLNSNVEFRWTEGALLGLPSKKVA
jgi:hypothetical protein